MKVIKEKKRKAILIALTVLSAVIAVISPISAATYEISNGQVTYDAGKDQSIWTFTVTCNADPEISNFRVAWCMESAVSEVYANVVLNGGSSWTQLTRHGKPYGWDYGEWDGLQGIKIDYQIEKGQSVDFKIILTDGQFWGRSWVDWAIKAGPGIVATGTVLGPDHNIQIPEFPTIAVPIGAIIGLLFFFNHRKHRKA
ncbi:MAG: PEF-CTERM sorting domain-containing protein [Methanophagales archaeon ANME-1-THS]|nr:MAG: PEF-CTERM sorting domain-containing protein [Methanophagales archaeon ANME-1-THS]